VSERLTNTFVDKLSPKADAYELRDVEVKGFLVRVQPTGKRVYYFSYRNSEGDKKRIWIGTHGSIAAPDARKAASQHAAKIALGEDVQKQKKQSKVHNERKKSQTLESFITNKYESWLETHSANGKAIIKRIKKHFFHFLNKQMEEITHSDIEDWRKARRKDGLAPATINRDISCLKALIGRAHLWEVISTNPLIRLKPLKTDSSPKIRYLNDKEEKALLMALDKREDEMRQKRLSFIKWNEERGYEPPAEIPPDNFTDHLKPMTLIALNTGMRRGEVFSLTWNNLNLDSKSPTVTVEGARAKSGNTRIIPLNAIAHKALKKWKKQTYKNNSKGLVFPNEHGNKFDNIKICWQNLLIAAKITDFRWHDLRHHFASKLVMRGVDINTVRELLGHSDITMTLRYAHLAPEVKAAAVAKLV